jgi:multidrug efflux pump subunit AcrB
LFREFAITLSVAILVSLVISLTTTPMMCARLLRPAVERKPGRIGRMSERAFASLVAGYRRSLIWVLDHGLIIMVVLLATVCLNIYLYVIIPKGFFPQQDTGRLIGGIQADQSISFQAMQKKLADFVDIVRQDPAVGECGCVHRRRATQLGADVRRPQAARRAQGVRRSGDRPVADQARQGAGCQSVPATGAGHPDRRPAEPMRNTNTRCRRTTWRTFARGSRR